MCCCFMVCTVCMSLVRLKFRKHLRAEDSKCKCNFWNLGFKARLRAIAGLLKRRSSLGCCALRLCAMGLQVEGLDITMPATCKDIPTPQRMYEAKTGEVEGSPYLGLGFRTWVSVYGVPVRHRCKTDPEKDYFKHCRTMVMTKVIVIDKNYDCHV